LERHHREWARLLTTRLSVSLRTDISFRLDEVKFADSAALFGGIATPTHLALFRVEPLPGVCLLEIPPKLGLAMVDRLLGGPGHDGASQRRLSEIEIALLDESISIALTAWCELWRSRQTLKPVVLDHEIDARLLDQDSRESAYLLATLTAHLDDWEEQVHVGLPCTMLQSLLPHAQITPSAAAPTQPPRWNELFDDVLVPVTFQFGELTLAAHQVATLKPGDLLPLDAGWHERIQLCLAGRPTFRGRLGSLHQQRALELTKLLEK
jgi:flagellar motor switch protein FliM